MDLQSPLRDPSPIGDNFQSEQRPIEVRKGVNIAWKSLENFEKFSVINSLQERRISPKRGNLDTVARFWRRHSPFTSLTHVKDTENSIQNLIQSTTDNLHRIHAFSLQAKALGKGTLGQYPDRTLFNNHILLLNQIGTELKLVEAKLKQLETLRKDVERLVEAHSQFDSLPNTIENLKKEYHHNVLQLETGRLLSNLEKELALYPHGLRRTKRGTWTQFITIKEKYFQLNQLFAGKDPSVVLTPQGLEKAIKKAFPALSHQTKRLIKYMIDVSKERVEDLKKNNVYLKSLITKYKKLAQIANQLESSLADQSISGRLYRFFNPAEGLKNRLKEVNKQMLAERDELVRYSKIDPAEFNSVKEHAKSYPHYRSLHEDMVTIQNQVRLIDRREILSFSMDQSIQELGVSERPNLVQNLGLLRRTMQAFVFEAGSLPPNFEHLDGREQFKVLVSLAYPTLQQKVDTFTQLLKKNNLKIDKIPLKEISNDTQTTDKSFSRSASNIVREHSSRSISRSFSTQEPRPASPRQLSPVDSSQVERSDLIKPDSNPPLHLNIPALARTTVEQIAAAAPSPAVRPAIPVFPIPAPIVREEIRAEIPTVASTAILSLQPVVEAPLDVSDQEAIVQDTPPPPPPSSDNSKDVPMAPPMDEDIPIPPPIDTDPSFSSVSARQNNIQTESSLLDQIQSTRLRSSSMRILSSSKLIEKPTTVFDLLRERLSERNEKIKDEDENENEW